MSDGQPDANAARLTQAAAALGLELDATAVGRMLAYLGMLQRWNRVYNLTAVRDPAEMLTHHLLDCLAVLPALRRHAAGRTLRVLDVGSGGGLPGVVIAIAQPDWQVSTIDAVAKKASFVRQVAAEVPVRNLRALHGRVEAIDPSLAPASSGYDVIVSRAFASLSDFVGLTRRLLAPGGVWLAMKGRAPDDEVGALPSDATVFHVEQLRVPELAAQRCLVWLRPHARP